MNYKYLLLILTLTPALSNASDSCDFFAWKQYQDIPLLSDVTRAAYIFKTAHKAADADGAPNAYHPNDIGLDYLANAGYPKSSWWKDVLVTDPLHPEIAYRQQDGAYKGYYISKTSLQDSGKQVTDTKRYVDASKVPYLVFPGSFYELKGSGMLGDIGYAINLSNGASSPFVVADIGPRDARLGEMSIQLAHSLGGINVNPRNGAGLPDGDILYIVFPYSAKRQPWPMSAVELDQASRLLMKSIGGERSVASCTSKLTRHIASKN